MKNLGLYNEELSVPCKKDVDGLKDVYAKLDASNIPSSNSAAWRSTIRTLPGIILYGKDDGGIIKVYTDAACTVAANYVAVMSINELGNALFLYNYNTYQCVGMQETAAGTGAYIAPVFARAEVTTAGVVVESVVCDIMGYLAGSVSAPAILSKQTYSLQSLPTVTAADNGKFLKVVDGAWAKNAVEAEDIGAQPKITVNGILKGDGDGNLSAQETAVATLVDMPTVPTKTSELTNDSGFITSVANGTSTDITGLLKGANNFVTAATAGTDYVMPAQLDDLREYYFRANGYILEQTLEITESAAFASMTANLNAIMTSSDPMIPADTPRPCIMAYGDEVSAEEIVILKYAGMGNSDELAVFNGTWYDISTNAQYAVSLLYKIGNANFDQYSVISIKEISPSTTTPLAPTATGSVGTSDAYARGDHSHPKEVFLITVTGESTSSLSCDKTYAQIISAINLGKICVLRYGDGFYNLARYYSSGNFVRFVNIINNEWTEIAISASGITYESFTPLPRTEKVTLTVANWNSSTKQQTVNAYYAVSDVTAQRISVMPANAAINSPYIAAGIQCVAQGNGNVTFACETIPTEAIDVYVETQYINYIAWE